MNKLKTPADLENIITSSKLKKDNKPRIIVATGTCGIARGADKIVIALKKELKQHSLESKVDIKITGCHGFCEIEPYLTILPEEIFYVKVQPDDIKEIISKTVIGKKTIERLLYTDPDTNKKITRENDIPFYKKQTRNILANNALIDPQNIEDYFGIGGYSSLSKVLTSMTPEAVIEEVKQSGIRGRGGAGFSTGFKWEFCRRAKGDKKYIVCNADEGDPGAYMDRGVLEGNPHSIIEGMIIGAYAIGANEGFVYIRDEYPIAVSTIDNAIKQARQYGLLGKNILNSHFDFDITIVRGAGAFVCGEETALIASIEGKKGEPRQRPPFPAQKGLWRKPTNINNVETWANIPVIISKGAKWFAEIGTEKSKGTKIFSLVGKINNTGLIEVPMGITLREIIYDIGGGIPKGKSFKGVQTGGPSGGCIPKDLLDTPIDYEKLKDVGSIMGSGGMVVMDEDTCMVDTARYFLEFLADESCGKCFTCREGIERMLEIVTDITEGGGEEKDIETLKDLGKLVKNTSMCGLGQTAPNPLLSTLTYFLNEYEQHIKYKRCSAGICKEIISSPCQHVCPIETEAPVYISLVAHGRFEEAFNIIRKDNPLPSVCARVCHHPCEFKCPSGKFGDPIAIKAIKRVVVDYAMEKGLKYRMAEHQQKKGEVAIIGSGPSGLIAGYYLAGKGYNVTIFEALPVVGGALAAYIPDYRLPQGILNYDIKNIEEAGVEIKTNTRVGKDISFEELRDLYDAIYIAVGAHNSLKLGIPDEDADGVLYALDFLRDIKLGKEVNIGARVGVIGGGNAAVDAARSVRRLKECKEVTIIYRRTRDEMPAFEEESEACLEENVKMQFLSAPKRILTENGKITGVECIQMQLGDMDESGRRKPVPIEKSEFVIYLDTLIIAVGEQPDVSFLGQIEGFEKTRWNTLVADPETYATNVDGVFAGGDVVTGPNTVVEAMGAGKVVAELIDKYLLGKQVVRDYEVTRPSMYVDPLELTDEEVDEARKPEIPCLPIDDRVCNFNEVESTLTKEDGIREARRCLRCDLETEEGKKWFETRWKKCYP